MVTDKPYIDKCYGTYLERTFIKTSDLVWHRDAELRIVSLLHGECAYIIDNETPVNMVVGREYIIPKETWHKIISLKLNSVFKIVKH